MPFFRQLNNHRHFLPGHVPLRRDVTAVGFPRGPFAGCSLRCLGASFIFYFSFAVEGRQRVGLYSHAVHMLKWPFVNGGANTRITGSRPM